MLRNRDARFYRTVDWNSSPSLHSPLLKGSHDIRSLLWDHEVMVDHSALGSTIRSSWHADTRTCTHPCIGQSLTLSVQSNCYLLVMQRTSKKKKKKRKSLIIEIAVWNSTGLLSDVPDAMSQSLTEPLLARGEHLRSRGHLKPECFSVTVHYFYGQDGHT